MGHYQLPAQRLNAISEILWCWEIIFSISTCDKAFNSNNTERK